ncbi:hypothetical protein L6452_37181 [Arctium lappa]|uniref:Uncharacterized protein n=1 Tax=Arctium lappa TaxID=4217 RepID=A0ACB8Y302_ARCLA|nr:hypothetical protein L6452_37181 [Arctium lappa]
MQPAMWTIRTDLEDFDLHFVYVLKSGLGQDLNQQSFEFDPFWDEHGIEQPSVQKPPIQEPSVQEQSVQEDDSEDSNYMEEEMAEVGVDMKNFSSIIDWDLE